MVLAGAFSGTVKLREGLLTPLRPGPNPLQQEPPRDGRHGRVGRGRGAGPGVATPPATPRPQLRAAAWPGLPPSAGGLGRHGAGSDGHTEVTLRIPSILCNNF